MSWYSDYKKSLKIIEVEDILDLIFYRPVAFLLVKAVYNTRITPNQLTLGSILMGIAAGLCYSVGKPEYFTFGAFFYIAFNVLDCSDGQLARLKQKCTPHGRIIDGIADTIATIAVYLGIGIGFANRSVNPLFWWLMLALAGFSNTIHGVLVDYYRNRFIDYVKERKNNFEESLDKYKNEYESIKDLKGRWFDRTVIRFYLNYSGFQRTLTENKKVSKPLNASPEEYYKRNKLIMRFWMLLGPTTQITTLVICSLFHRFDVFIWIIIFCFNGLALVLWLIQQLIERELRKK